MKASTCFYTLAILMILSFFSAAICLAISLLSKPLNINFLISSLVLWIIGVFFILLSENPQKIMERQARRKIYHEIYKTNNRSQDHTT